MHILRSSVIGTEIIDEAEYQIHGKLTDLLLDADRGKVVALLLSTAFGAHPLALQTDDVVSWGQRIHIRTAEVLGPTDEFIRLQAFLEDNRPIIGQRIRTKSNIPLGTCIDLQLNTDTFAIEWVFPRRFFVKGLALPVSDILEVTEDAIIVKDQGPKEEKILSKEEPTHATLEPLITPSV